MPNRTCLAYQCSMGHCGDSSSAFSTISRQTSNPVAGGFTKWCSDFLVLVHKVHFKCVCTCMRACVCMHMHVKCLALK